ncbi:biotin/lipoyl-containing protein [Nereida ignava]|uniref:biotin/lipoyl-containing protein n=1 Tax=Nereida ignava TaxID=282199 RepID=UPI0023B65B65
MPHEVIMPALGMAQDTGRIVNWLKAAGDPVKVGDALFEVETDKATMEVESPADGFLTDITAQEGADVPVGNVIAYVSETAAGGSSEATVSPETTTHESAANTQASLPEGKAVIMPALGMAQDTGVIVSWHKALGDKVAATDILFEVETDKATMEVEAGSDGYVAALLAEETEAAPVGETIAIISPTPPADPVQRSIASSGTVTAAPVPAPVSEEKAHSKDKIASEKATEAVTAKPMVQPVGSRILASPKARRLALEQGLDLKNLVDAGRPQPFHVADIEFLKGMPKQETGKAEVQSRHITAEVRGQGFAEFVDWAIENAGLAGERTALAGFAGASLKQEQPVVSIESFGQRHTYFVSAGPLKNVVLGDDDTTPDLIVRDLRMSHLNKIQLGAEETPVLTLTSAADSLIITLECAGQQLAADKALQLLSEFAGRMEQPLRHLL